MCSIKQVACQVPVFKLAERIHPAQLDNTTFKAGWVTRIRIARVLDGVAHVLCAAMPFKTALRVGPVAYQLDEARLSFSYAVEPATQIKAEFLEE